ncbi:hypothetical protein VSU19_16485 [Verrucomicrobiales bacterium BCK34]|nr:hypothetical protein [Verrucomicrobiales bacterium BCK34]
MKRLPLTFAVLFAVLPLCSSADDWADKIKKTSLEYAEKKKNELVQESSKKAILEIYKKMYPKLKNKSDREAFRQLGELGMNASRLNSLASDLASGDPKKVQGASEELAVDLGKKLTTMLKTGPETRRQMEALLGNAGTVKDVSSHLGSLAGGDPQPLMEYAGDLVIQAAGGAGVVGFYRNAYGVMKFAKDAFVDSQIEDFYQQYKKGNFDPMQMDLAGSHFAIRDKIIAEKASKNADLGRVDVNPALREHLTRVDEEEFKRRLLAGFEARAKKEVQAAEDKVTAEEAQKQAEEILEILESTARGEGRSDWTAENSGVPMKFLELVRRKAAEDPFFDPDNTNDLKLMGRLFANQLVHGPNSPEFKKALEDFTRIREIRGGVTPRPTGIPSGTLTGSWSGKYSTISVGGSFRLRIDSDGKISGSYSGDDSGSLSGRVSSSGQLNVSSGGGKAGKGSWQGTITKGKQGGISGQGSWSSGSSRGSWRGKGG